MNNTHTFELCYGGPVGSSTGARRFCYILTNVPTSAKKVLLADIADAKAENRYCALSYDEDTKQFVVFSSKEIPKDARSKTAVIGSLSRYFRKDEDFASYGITDLVAERLKRAAHYKSVYPELTLQEIIDFLGA